MDMEQNPIETGLYRIRIVTLAGVKGLGLGGSGGRDGSALQVAIFNIFILYFGFREIYWWTRTLFNLKDI